MAWHFSNLDLNGVSQHGGFCPKARAAMRLERNNRGKFIVRGHSISRHFRRLDSLFSTFFAAWTQCALKTQLRKRCSTLSASDMAQAKSEQIPAEFDVVTHTKKSRSRRKSRLNPLLRKHQGHVNVRIYPSGDAMQ